MELLMDVRVMNLLMCYLKSLFLLCTLLKRMFSMITSRVMVFMIWPHISKMHFILNSRFKEQPTETITTFYHTIKS